MGYWDLMLIRGVPRDHLHDTFSARFSAECPAQAATAHVWLQQTPNHVIFGGSTSHPPAEAIMSRIVAEAGGTTLTIRWQDGDSWQITLQESGQVLANFISNPRCHDEEPDQEAALRAGRTIAARWNLPEERIIGYFRYFEEGDEDARAYPEDEYPAGWADQVYDFMRATGLDSAWQSTQVEPIVLKPRSEPHSTLGQMARKLRFVLPRVFSSHRRG